MRGDGNVPFGHKKGEVGTLHGAALASWSAILGGPLDEYLESLGNVLYGHVPQTTDEGAPAPAEEGAQPPEEPEDEKEKE